VARPPCGVASLEPEARQQQRCQSVSLTGGPTLSPRQWDELDDCTTSLMIDERPHTARARYSNKFYAPRTAVEGHQSLQAGNKTGTRWVSVVAIIFGMIGSPIYWCMAQRP